MRVYLLRSVNNRVRYYYLEFSLTLFGDYCLERVYGSIYNKKPTGVKKEYFQDFNKGLSKFKSLLNQKIKKGYLLDK